MRFEDLEKQKKFTALKPFNEAPETTITFDNGMEFVGHQKIAERLGARVYFANPYSAWERGCNENANGLIRQHLPKSTPLNETSYQQAKDTQNNLNNRPRKKLGFKTPNEVFLRWCYT